MNARPAAGVSDDGPGVRPTTFGSWRPARDGRLVTADRQPSCRHARPSAVTWEDLFERAAAYGATEDDVRTALATVRGTDDADDGSEREAG
jgi:hypothetical protein